MKTVSAPGGSVTIPVSNVNISVSMQQKGGLGKGSIFELPRGKTNNVVFEQV